MHTCEHHKFNRYIVALVSNLTQSVEDMFNKSQTENKQVLRDNYLVKSEALKERLGFITDSSAVARLLDNLESTFDDIEEQLKTTILGNKTCGRHRQLFWSYRIFNYPCRYT